MASYVGGVLPNDGKTIREVRALRLYYFFKSQEANVTLVDSTGRNYTELIDYDVIGSKMEYAVHWLKLNLV